MVIGPAIRHDPPVFARRSLVASAAIAVALSLVACGTSAFDIEVGDCYGAVGDEVGSVDTVSCDEPHVYEVFAVVNHSAGDDADYPGESALSTFADEECLAAFEGYVGAAFADSEFFYSFLSPTQESWENGDREIICQLQTQDASEITGSQRNSGR